MLEKFDHDQANSHRVIYKRFGVEEYWSNIKAHTLMGDMFTSFLKESVFEACL